MENSEIQFFSSNLKGNRKKPDNIEELKKEFQDKEEEDKTISLKIKKKFDTPNLKLSVPKQKKSQFSWVEKSNEDDSSDSKSVIPSTLKPVINIERVNDEFDIPSTLQLSTIIKKNSSTENLRQDFKRIIQTEKIVRSNLNGPFVKGFAFFTDGSNIRLGNEDRVVALINIKRPKTIVDGEWPPCHLFCLYDGHNGSNTAHYLSNNLHERIIKDSSFILNTEEVLKRSILLIDNELIKLNSKGGKYIDKSGSSSILCAVINEDIFVANTGDSKAIISNDSGKESFELNIQHLLKEKSEFERVIKEGAEIFKVKSIPIKKNILGVWQLIGEKDEIFKIKRWDLEFSRSIGDMHVKIANMAEKKKEIIPDPDTKILRKYVSIDFMLIYSQGIHQYMQPNEIITIVWNLFKTIDKEIELKTFCADAIEEITKESINRGSKDDISIIFILFKNFKRLFDKKMENIKSLSKTKFSIAKTTNKPGEKTLSSTFKSNNSTSSGLN